MKVGYLIANVWCKARLYLTYYIMQGFLKNVTFWPQLSTKCPSHSKNGVMLEQWISYKEEIIITMCILLTLANISWVKVQLRRRLYNKSTVNFHYMILCISFDFYAKLPLKTILDHITKAKHALVTELYESSLLCYVVIFIRVRV
jgi:hypothetical protein